MGPALHFWDEQWLSTLFYFIMSPTLPHHPLWGRGMERGREATGALPMIPKGKLAG